VATRAEAALIRLSAATAARRHAATDEADRLTGRVDWSALAEMLVSRRLLPLLGERIVTLSGERAPAGFVQATRRAIEACAADEALLELLSIQIIDALRTAGIPSLALKGPALGRALYGGPGRRPSSDIDVLVKAEDLRHGAEVATRLGYRDPDGVTDVSRLPLLHRRMVHRQPGLPVLELHWRVHWYEQRFARDMLARSSPDGPLGARAAPADELTSLLLFYARDGFVDLRLACDLATWWDRFGVQLAPGSVAGEIERYPSLERVLIAAAEVGDRVLGVPSSALLGGERPRLDQRLRTAIRLANPDARGSTTQHHADTLLIDLLLTPRGGHREAIRRQLRTPAGTQLGQRAPDRDGPSEATDQALRLLRRYALGLVRVTREWIARALSARRTYSLTSRP
jgi:hypothetical protein